MKISSIETKDNEAVELHELTVLVGPNNVGKSQTLKDLRKLPLNQDILESDTYS